jgi:hypothetical protein
MRIPEEEMRKRTVWYTKKCGWFDCNEMVRVSYIKPVKKEDWEEPVFCEKHHPFRMKDKI